MASLFIANLMLVVLNLPFVGVWVRLLMIPRPWLYAGILTFATLGIVGAQGSVFALVLLLGFGLVGFVMRRFGYPLAPVLVGAILGPLAEEQLRRGLMINRGDWTFLVTSPDRADHLCHRRRGGSWPGDLAHAGQRQVKDRICDGWRLGSIVASQ